MNNHSENIQKVYTMIGEKLPTSKVKVGLIIGTIIVAGITAVYLADDIAYAMHAIQQKNIRERMVEIHELAEGHRDAIEELKAEYDKLEARLDVAK